MTHSTKPNPSDTPLTSRLISLTAESSYPILGALGRPAQAWFLGLVLRADPQLATVLHDSQGLKPYTVSSLLDDHGRPLQAGSWLRPGQSCWIRVTTCHELLASVLEQKILPHLPERVTLYKMNFRVDGVARTRAEHPWAGSSSYTELAQDINLVNAGASVRMEFASPTAFRSNGLDICLPEPARVFRNLWEKWNQYCPEAMQVQDIWPQFAANCIFINELTSINTTRWVFAEGTHGAATGFTGTVAYFLPAEHQLPEHWQPYADGAQAVLHSLARFSLYAGIGHHTTIGMGQAQLLAGVTPRAK